MKETITSSYIIGGVPDFKHWSFGGFIPSILIGFECMCITWQDKRWLNLKQSDHCWEQRLMCRRQSCRIVAAKLKTSWCYREWRPMECVILRLWKLTFTLNAEFFFLIPYIWVAIKSEFWFISCTGVGFCLFFVFLFLVMLLRHPLKHHIWKQETLSHVQKMSGFLVSPVTKISQMGEKYNDIQTDVGLF